MEKYFELLDKHTPNDFSHCANRDHKSRSYTFRYIWDEMMKIECPVIVELGTTRSFKGGWHEGCLKFDIKYWEPDKIEDFDWSAGNFTYVFGQLPKKEFHTVDINPKHIWVAKTMTEGMKEINYYISDSVEFLKDLSKDFGILDKQCDLIYMDTGDVCESTALLHKREAEIIVERELVRIGGYVLLDDVRSNAGITQFGERSRFGKDKYSIGVFLANGFDIVMDEYQMVLKRMG